MNKTWLGAAALMHFLAYPFAALAEDGISDNEIMLGQTVGLTGLVADPVKETNEGANLFFDAVNGNGGVNGRKVKLVTIDDKFDPELAEWIAYGASPRGSIALDRCARAHAWLAGRDFVSPEDIQAVLFDVLRHRIILSFEAEASGIDQDRVIQRILDVVAVA